MIGGNEKRSHNVESIRQGKPSSDWKKFRVDYVLYLTGDVNFTLHKFIVWEREPSNSANLKRFISTKEILLAGDKQAV
jgi:hypothetical protein